MNYILYNESKYQLMMLLPDLFNKRTYFWVISIAWLCPTPNLILEVTCFLICKRVFGSVGIKWIVFFFLATIFIMATFSFQFWVRKEVGSWYYLTCCTSLFFRFFNVLLNKWNCFRPVELHVVQLIVILFHLTALTDLILYYFKFIVLLIKLDRMICFASSSYFFAYINIICYTPSKNPECKIQITAKKKLQCQVFH